MFPKCSPHRSCEPSACCNSRFLWSVRTEIDQRFRVKPSFCVPRKTGDDERRTDSFRPRSNTIRDRQRRSTGFHFRCLKSQSRVRISDPRGRHLPWRGPRHRPQLPSDGPAHTKQSFRQLRRDSRPARHRPRISSYGLSLCTHARPDDSILHPAFRLFTTDEDEFIATCTNRSAVNAERSYHGSGPSQITDPGRELIPPVSTALSSVVLPVPRHSPSFGLCLVSRAMSYGTAVHFTFAAGGLDLRVHQRNCVRSLVTAVNRFLALGAPLDGDHKTIFISCRHKVLTNDGGDRPY
jgi:hypothetical protein